MRQKSHKLSWSQWLALIQSRLHELCSVFKLIVLEVVILALFLDELRKILSNLLKSILHA